MSRDYRPALSKALSQHRLRTPDIARRIIASTGLAPPSLVLEPGAGRGILTHELSRVSGFVVAIEKDPAEYARLLAATRAHKNVRPVLGDFLSTPLPRQPYHVVGNLPFSVTAATLRRLTSAPNAPVSIHLIVERDAALHWLGQPRTSVVSLVTSLRFEATIPLALRRRDFEPFPSVDTVVLRLVRRPKPLLAGWEAERFSQLVSAGFGAGRATALKNLERAARSREWARCFERAGVRHDASPGEITHEQWLRLLVEPRDHANGRIRRGKG